MSSLGCGIVAAAITKARWNEREVGYNSCLKANELEHVLKKEILRTTIPNIPM
jgi:hypothetical protein